MGARQAIATAFDVTGASTALRRLHVRLSAPHIRVLNYHDVPAEQAGGFEAQLRYYRERYRFVGMDDLLALWEDRWTHDRPGLLLTFDDGLDSHAEVVAPLLDAYGAQGWFMVPAAVLDDGGVVPSDQHTVGQSTMTWEQLRRLDARHVIGCHTFSHRRLEAALTPEDLEHEIVESKRVLEEGLGHEVSVFTWVGGEEWTYSADAARAIKDAGYRLGFMTNNATFRPGCDLLQIQRTNIEASFDPSLVKLSLSGFYDLYYTMKRRRVNRLTAV